MAIGVIHCSNLPNERRTILIIIVDPIYFKPSFTIAPLKYSSQRSSNTFLNCYWWHVSFANTPSCPVSYSIIYCAIICAICTISIIVTFHTVQQLIQTNCYTHDSNVMSLSNLTVLWCFLFVITRLADSNHMWPHIIYFIHRKQYHL